MPPNERISGLGAAAPLLLTDHVLVARGSAPPNFKATIQAVLALGGGVGGGGTINKIPIWVSPGVLGDSALTQSGVSVTANGQFNVRRTEIGGQVALLVVNLDNTDAASDAALRLITGGVLGGDPIVQWSGGAQTYVLGVDNSEDDKFVGSVGVVLGTANWLEVTIARGITLDAASGQTVALAVNATEELQVSGIAVTIPTNNLVLTTGGINVAGNVKIGEAGVAAQMLHLKRADANVVQVFLENTDTSVGYGASAGLARIFVGGTEKLRIGAADTIFNQGQVDTNFVVRAVASATALVVDGVTGDVSVSQDLTVSGGIGIGNPPTLPLDVNAKGGITSIGGIAVKLTNKTGSNTSAGQLVIASTSTANAFETAGASDDRVIGIVFESGVVDGSEAWIVYAGFASVKMDAGGAAFGDRIISSTTAGTGLVSNNPGSPAVHFQEIGHSLGTAVGGGFVKCSIHLN